MVARGLEHRAIRNSIRRYPKIYRNCKAVGKFGLLNIAVGREKMIVGHLGVADIADCRLSKSWSDF